MSDKLTAEKDRVVSFHYVLTEVEGARLESSSGGEPMAALIGHGNMMEGLEAALLGRTAGEQFEVALAPEQTFGERRDDWTQRIQKKHVPKGTRLRPGAQIQLQTDDGPRLVTVVKVGSSVVDVDLNHPFAGKTLVFAIELLEVREASEEEIAHGHAHGAGGHHH